MLLIITVIDWWKTVWEEEEEEELGRGSSWLGVAENEQKHVTLVKRGEVMEARVASVHGKKNSSVYSQCSVSVGHKCIKTRQTPWSPQSPSLVQISAKIATMNMKMRTLVMTGRITPFSFISSISVGHATVYGHCKTPSLYFNTFYFSIELSYRLLSCRLLSWYERHLPTKRKVEQNL